MENGHLQLNNAIQTLVDIDLHDKTLLDFGVFRAKLASYRRNEDLRDSLPATVREINKK